MAGEVIQLREDGMLLGVITGQLVKMVRCWVYFKVKANIIGWQVLCGK